MTAAVPFPASQPSGYAWLEGEPPFEPSRHLQLEEPSEILLLTDVGYSAEEISELPTNVACSSPFRVLSDEGAEILLSTARRLREFCTPAGDRIEHVVRGGCYRSKWLRDLALSEEVSSHLGNIYGIAVAPHPMGHHLGHLNYEPSTIERSIDRWHHDTLPLDYVMPVTDPALVAGGRFEYFVGTKAEAAELAQAGKTPPPERTVAPEFPGPGYAVALHGDMVVHRAGELTALTERISMVNGYVPLDTSGPPQSRHGDLIGIDPDGALWTEWAKFAAWRSHQRLGTLFETLPFTADRERVIAELRESIADVTLAIDEMSAGERPAEHYERKVAD